VQTAGFMSTTERNNLQAVANAIGFTYSYTTNLGFFTTYTYPPLLLIILDHGVI
jgi:hypothetical protein